MEVAHRTYRYFDAVRGSLLGVLGCANLIGPAKAATLTLPLMGPVTFGAGVLFFPISYIFGDMLTEVYGYARARRVIWAGFAALVFAAVMAAVIVALPPAPTWPNQHIYEVAFGSTWRHCRPDWPHRRWRRRRSQHSRRCRRDRRCSEQVRLPSRDHW